MQALDEDDDFGEDDDFDEAALQVGTAMVTSSNGNIFRVSGLLCGEFTGDR